MSNTLGFGVEGHLVAHRPKISQIEGSRPQPREWLGRNRGGYTSLAPSKQESSREIVPPQENRPEGGDLEDDEEGLVGGEEGGCPEPAKAMGFDHC
ncbi:hypothetical protein CRG98_034620 [Punica granatum]|uniref:Uncharacterized protein n=1 Tax=Punica granatum TaxID=22663 RepID=A0A2I0ILV3_PUNGR|nr:hypothetical protein CRG98_034620 [Punica granatum]